MSFEQQFLEGQSAVHARKVYLTTSRALATQARAKIKPAAMRPNLLNQVRHSAIRGGDFIQSQAKNDFFYYPQVVDFSRGATTQSTDTPLTASEWTDRVVGQTDLREELVAADDYNDYADAEYKLEDQAGFAAPTQSAQNMSTGNGIRF